MDVETGNVDLTDLKKKLSKNTKIIYFVHWGGTPVDLDAVDELREYGCTHVSEKEKMRRRFFGPALRAFVRDIWVSKSI